MTTTPTFHGQLGTRRVGREGRGDYNTHPPRAAECGVGERMTTTPILHSQLGRGREGGDYVLHSQLGMGVEGRQG